MNSEGFGIQIAKDYSLPPALFSLQANCPLFFFPPPRLRIRCFFSKDKVKQGHLFLRGSILINHERPGVLCRRNLGDTSTWRAFFFRLPKGILISLPILTHLRRTHEHGGTHQQFLGARFPKNGRATVRVYGPRAWIVSHNLEKLTRLCPRKNTANLDSLFPETRPSKTSGPSLNRKTGYLLEKVTLPDHCRKSQCLAHWNYSPPKGNVSGPEGFQSLSLSTTSGGPSVTVIPSLKSSAPSYSSCN